MPLLLLLLLCLGVTAQTDAVTAPSHRTTPKLSAYEALASYNLPIGLLPQGALGYDLNPSTGKFSAYLNGSCSFSLEGSYQLRYKSTISGYVSENRLKDLRGVSVKFLLFWVNIVEVTRSGDELEFSVGIASAGFPISNFEVCPKCGCGLDCLNLPGAERDSRVKWRTSF